jgi:hypothetical protein
MGVGSIGVGAQPWEARWREPAHRVQTVALVREFTLTILVGRRWLFVASALALQPPGPLELPLFVVRAR